MTAGRPRRAASTVLAACGCLLAVIALSGCNVQREFVRRGQLLDSLTARAVRIETGQATQGRELRTLRADVVTELQRIEEREDQTSAQLADLADRLDRISRRLGVGRGNLTTATPEAQPPAETLRTAPDTAGMGLDQLYNTAYLDFTRGKYEVAADEFRQYVSKFPTSENADNAQYWVGECLYSLGRYDEAEREFRAVLANYPDGNKVPAAAYKLGLVYQSLKRRAEARRQFQKVVQSYPDTPEAKLAQERLRSQE